MSSQLIFNAIKKSDEHDLGVKSSIKILRSENFTTERLLKLQANEIAWQNRNSKFNNKASKCVLDACNFLLNKTI